MSADLSHRACRMAALSEELRRLLRGAQNAKSHQGAPVSDADFCTAAMLAVAALSVEAMPLDAEMDARIGRIAGVFQAQLARCALQRLARPGDGPRAA